MLNLLFSEKKVGKKASCETAFRLDKFRGVFRRRSARFLRGGSQSGRADEDIRPYGKLSVGLGVGADVSSARRSSPGHATWHKLGGPGGSGKPKLPPCQGPVARKEGKTPLKFCPPVENTGRRCPTKNGVLVPLPPWAKEPAAGAAEFPLESKVKTEGVTISGHSLGFLFQWCRSETKFRRKFFCLLFFQEK